MLTSYVRLQPFKTSKVNVAEVTPEQYNLRMIDYIMLFRCVRKVSISCTHSVSHSVTHSVRVRVSGISVISSVSGFSGVSGFPGVSGVTIGTRVIRVKSERCQE